MTTSVGFTTADLECLQGQCIVFSLDLAWLGTLAPQICDGGTIAFLEQGLAGGSLHAVATCWPRLAPSLIVHFQLLNHVHLLKSATFPRHASVLH